jgi:HlyD family secretion protein
MKGNKKTIIIISIVCIAVLAGTFGVINARKPKTKEVLAQAIDKKDLVQSISVSGNIEANDKFEINLSPTQKITKVYFKEGDTVKKGDVLVKLDTTDLEYQIKKAILNLDILKIGSSNANKQATINLESAKSTYDHLKKKFDANQELFNNGYISQEEYDTSKKSLLDAENQIKLAEIQYNSSQLNNSDSDKKKQIELTQADIENLKKKIADSSIKSTVNGKVIKLSVKEGQFPANTNSLVQVCDLSVYKVKVEVSQYDAVLISTGQKAAIKVKGLDKKYTGTITSISPVAEITMNGTNQESKVKVEISIDNPDTNIKVGYEVDAEITLKQKPSTFAVGFEAIKTDSNNKKYVFVIENGVAKKRYVKTGLETDFDIEILEGLKQGEQYIPSPADDLKEGDLVKLPEVTNDDNKN